MARKRRTRKESAEAWRLFEAEAAYAESIFRDAIGDTEASIAAAEQALEIKPDYPPAVLTMGSIEYQRGREEDGARLFRTLLSLPDESGDLWEFIDKAGDFLIQEERYAEGLELYEAAVRRFPGKATLYQGFGCCAGHEGLLDKAVNESRKALPGGNGRVAPEACAQTRTRMVGTTQGRVGGGLVPRSSPQASQQYRAIGVSR